MWDYMNGGMGFGMGLGMLLIWGVLIALVVVLIRGAMGLANTNRQARTALDILEERYARGEIGREEFEQKKRDLQA
ncbi:MAG: SHOCT domain-containing protein [Pseudomonadota bacterium]